MKYLFIDNGDVERIDNLAQRLASIPLNEKFKQQFRAHQKS